MEMIGHGGIVSHELMGDRSYSMLITAHYASPRSWGHCNTYTGHVTQHAITSCNRASCLEMSWGIPVLRAG